MITPQNHSSSGCVNAGNEVHHIPLKQINGTVFVCHFSPCWIPTCTHSLLMGSYPEIFKGRGEFVLSLYIGLKDSEGGKLFSEKGIGPLYLPLDLFLGRKEGDVLEIVCKEKQQVLKLTCTQEGSRYKALHKSFECMVEDAFMGAYEILFDKYKNGSLLEHELSCWEEISEMKLKFYSNVMVRV